MSVASAKGFNQYIEQNIAVKTQAELDILETDMINEADENVRRVKKGEFFEASAPAGLVSLHHRRQEDVVLLQEHRQRGRDQRRRAAAAAKQAWKDIGEIGGVKITEPGSSAQFLGCKHHVETIQKGGRMVKYIKYDMEQFLSSCCDTHG